MQSKGKGVQRGNKSQFPETVRTLRGEDLVFGSILFLTKPAPTPRYRFNLFVKYSTTSGKFEIPADLQRTINKLDHQLGQSSDTEHAPPALEVFDVDDSI